MDKNPENEQLPLRILPSEPDASDRAAYEAVELDEQQRYSALRRFEEETVRQREWLARKKEQQ